MKEPAVQLLQSPSLWALRQAAEGKEGKKESRSDAVPALCQGCSGRLADRQPCKRAQSLAGSIELQQRTADTLQGRAGCRRSVLTFNLQSAVAYASRLNCRCSSLLRRSARPAADLRARGELNEDFKLWLAIKMAAWEGVTELLQLLCRQ